MEIGKTILLCFKNHKELRNWERKYMRAVDRRGVDYIEGDTLYTLKLMSASSTCGLSASEVFFINCTIDDTSDYDFKLTLRVLENTGTIIHWDNKEAEEFQNEIMKRDFYRRCVDKIIRDTGELTLINIHNFIKDGGRAEIANEMYEENKRIEDEERDKELYKMIADFYGVPLDENFIQ